MLLYIIQNHASWYSASRECCSKLLLLAHCPGQIFLPEYQYCERIHNYALYSSCLFVQNRAAVLTITILLGNLTVHGFTTI